MAKRLKSLSNRVFHSLAEFEEDAEQRTKIALMGTLKYFKKEFKEIADSHIYKNAYTPKWYTRTHWLRDEDAIEAYIYKNVKNAIGGGVRFNRKAYDKRTEGFQHGNPVHYLPMNSYLAIMNDSSLLPKGNKNIFHFPTNSEIDRGHFYDEFLDLVDREFDAKFEENWERAGHYISTGKVDLRGFNNSNKTSVGATSSSTKQYASLNSRNV